MYQIAYGEVPEGANGEEWEYSMHDISEELHTSIATTGRSPSDDSKSATRGCTPIVKVRSPATRGHSPVCTTRGRETKVSLPLRSEFKEFLKRRKKFWCWNVKTSLLECFTSKIAHLLFLITLICLRNRYHRTVHTIQHHITMETHPLMEPDPRLATTPTLVLTPEIHPQAQIWVTMLTSLSTIQTIQVMTTSRRVTMPTSVLTTETIAIHWKGWTTWKTKLSVISMKVMRAHFQPEVWKPER